MAVLQSIRNLFVPLTSSEPEIVIPAPLTNYSIKPLTPDDLGRVLRLNLRCFRNGENYSKQTFNYLLTQPDALSYMSVTPKGELVGFIFLMMNPNGSAHITTVGVAPEHRRRGIAHALLSHVEERLRAKEVSTIVLEVRVSNVEAQSLYRSAGYTTVKRIARYYHNGEDCFLMMKALLPD